MDVMTLLAQAPGNQAMDLKGMIFFFGPFVLIIVVMYYLIFRAQQKETKRRKLLLESVKTGDKVLTAGGIFGVVANVKENSLIIKIADNVKVEVTRASISGTVDKDGKVVNQSQQ